MTVAQPTPHLPTSTVLLKTARVKYEIRDSDTGRLSSAAQQVWPFGTGINRLLLCVFRPKDPMSETSRPWLGC
jgi:hypothetical protein